MVDILVLTFYNSADYHLSFLHDALPISWGRAAAVRATASPPVSASPTTTKPGCFSKRDRKSTRLNSSHSQRSYALFFLKKKIRQGDRPPVCLRRSLALTHPHQLPLLLQA